MKKCYLVTGGADFIGSCFVLQARNAGIQVVTLDKLIYSSNLLNLASLQEAPYHHFVRACIGNEDLVTALLQQYQPDAICNFAAESHVDKSIYDPDVFARTNVLGTCTLLRTCLKYWQGLSTQNQKQFRFLHVSTDEIFGSLQLGDPTFKETTLYAPNSPYAASKAANNHA